MPVNKRSSIHKQRARSGLSPVLIVEPPRIVLEARNDIGILAEYVTDGRLKPAAVHRTWFESLQDKGVPYLSILAPRGSGKSVWMGIYSAWVIGDNPLSQIIYTGYSENVALKQSRIVKRILESPKFREVFPWIRPSKRWADTDWEIDKQFAEVSNLDSDYTFYAVGVTGSITSKRSSLIIFDDLIKSSHAIANPDVRETMAVNIEEVILPTLIPISSGGLVRSIGTRFRRDDIHALNFTPEHGWKVIENSAIQPDGSSYWSERFPIEDLERIQQRSPLTFAYQYQNKIPPDDDEAIIRGDWIRYGDVPNFYDELCLGVDLAATEKERADWTAYVLVGKRGDYFYVIDCWRFRDVGNLDKIERIKQIKLEYPRLSFRVVIERGGYQNSFEGDWRVAARKNPVLRAIVCEHSPLRTNADKDSRLRGVSGIFANGLVVFNRNRPMNTLVNELLRLTLDHDDLCDALVHALARLQRRSRKPLTSVG